MTCVVLFHPFALMSFTICKIRHHTYLQNNTEVKTPFAKKVFTPNTKNVYIIHILKGPNWFILMNKFFGRMWSQTYFLALCISTKNNKTCECFALMQKDERCQKTLNWKIQIISWMTREFWSFRVEQKWLG
jgi:hypothetical protein